MNTAPDDPLHVAINAKLKAIAESSPSPPAWYDAWMRLGSDSPEEERLAVYQAVRDAGSLPEDAGFYLVSWQIDALTSLEAETSLQHMQDRLEAIAHAHGLEDGGAVPLDAVSNDYEKLLHEYLAAWDRVYLAKLEAFGEQGIAGLYRSDQEEFLRKSNAGRQYFHGLDDEEAWLEELVREVAGTMAADNAAGHLGYRWQEEGEFWEVLIYPQPVELVGGKEDGEIVTSGFTLDLEGMKAVFEQVEAFVWQSLGFPNDEGPRVSIEGIYQGHEVFVQVLAYPPEDEEPGTRIDTRKKGR